MFRVLFSAIALCAFGYASAAPPQTALASLPNVSFPAANRVAAGAVTATDIGALKAADVRAVIDLRAAGETPDFDERAAMRDAGISYHNLPIGSADDLSRDNVRRFDKLLSDAGDRLTLVHCASSNRVGAMIALRAAMIDGQSNDAALAEGRRWGLKSLEPVVQQRLQTWQTNGKPGPAESH